MLVRQPNYAEMKFLTDLRSDDERCMDAACGRRSCFVGRGEQGDSTGERGRLRGEWGAYPALAGPCAKAGATADRVSTVISTGAQRDSLL